jgi:cytochrome c oxidase subunit 3
MRTTPFDDPVERFRAGLLGMRILLVSLGILFAASILGYVVIRLQIGSRWPDLPSLPNLLWLSTIALVVSSLTMQWAAVCARRGRVRPVRVALVLTLILAIAFLALQTDSWIQWMRPVMDNLAESDEYRFALAAFYVFTGLHATHVIGGLAPMLVITARSMHISGARLQAGALPGVQYVAMYWHFLDAVWIVLFVTLKISL